MWDEILKWLHVHKNSKKGKMKINLIVMFNVCETLSTMKHEGFHLGFFFKSFVFKGVSHSTKSLHVWQLVMIHATNILM